MKNNHANQIQSIDQYIRGIREYAEKHWTQERLLKVKDHTGKPYPDRQDIGNRVRTRWYRGQSRDWSLLPRVYRSLYDEREMMFDCRRKASMMEHSPSWDDLPAWLLLMQHHVLPTRLIDWTSSSAVALFFAVYEWEIVTSKSYHPVVWLLNPNAMNWTGLGCSFLPGTGQDEAVIDGEKMVFGYGQKNIRSAFGAEERHIAPMAISGRYAHIRMRVQNSRFLVWGSDKRSLNDYFAGTSLFFEGFLKPFYIDPFCCKRILIDLKDLGISRSTLFPDFKGIAEDLSNEHRQESGDVAPEV